MSQKAAVISIVGKPNAGKSTLLNRFIGQKISIITPKVQTTRNIINGIYTNGDTQLVFLDTPGIFAAKTRLEKLMVRYAWSSIAGADIVILLLDITEQITPLINSYLRKLLQAENPVIILLNKIDHPKNQLQTWLEYFQQTWPALPLFKISALHKEGVLEVLQYLSTLAPQRAFSYAQEELTTLPSRFLAAECTREQLFLHLHQEVPYQLTVENELFELQQDDSLKIHQIILVTSERYKQMILGAQGKRIRQIGTKARLEIEKVLGRKTHLFLFIKVRENWLDRPEVSIYS